MPATPAPHSPPATPVLQRLPRSSTETPRVPVHVTALAPPSPTGRTDEAAIPDGPAAAFGATQVVLPDPTPLPAHVADSPLLSALPVPAEGGPFIARPAPTRTAVLAAFSHAVERAPVVPPPAPTPAQSSIAPLMRAPLSRVETDSPSPHADGESGAKAPDLDAIADFVLERLRHELRDGRERLGFLLDDMR